MNYWMLRLTTLDVQVKVTILSPNLMPVRYPREDAAERSETGTSKEK